MAFDPAPAAFFGKSYALTSSSVTLPTVDKADATLGSFTAVGDSVSAVLTTSVPHLLKVGDKVAISGAALPAPLTAADHFVVSVPGASTLTLSLTKNGTAIVPTTAGTPTHTMVALSVLQEVTDIEAHATSGDSRKVVYGIVEAMRLKYVNTPTADRPAKMTIAGSSSTNETTGVVTKYINFTFITDPIGFDVVAE